MGMGHGQMQAGWVLLPVQMPAEFGQGVAYLVDVQTVGADSKNAHLRLP